MWLNSEILFPCFNSVCTGVIWETFVKSIMSHCMTQVLPLAKGLDMVGWAFTAWRLMLSKSRWRVLMSGTSHVHVFAGWVHTQTRMSLHEFSHSFISLCTHIYVPRVLPHLTYLLLWPSNNQISIESLPLDKKASDTSENETLKCKSRIVYPQISTV